MMDDEYGVWGRTDGTGHRHPLGRAGRLPPDQQDRQRRPRRPRSTTRSSTSTSPPRRSASTRSSAWPTTATGSAAAARSASSASARPGPSTIGNPHDAMYPLHRFVHWMAHEGGDQAGCRPRLRGRRAAGAVDHARAGHCHRGISARRFGPGGQAGIDCAAQLQTLQGAGGRQARIRRPGKCTTISTALELRAVPAFVNDVGPLKAGIRPSLYATTD